MEWRAPEDKIRAALNWQPDEPESRTPEQEAYLIKQGYIPEGYEDSLVAIRTRAMDNKLLRQASAGGADHR
jgi:hypothetical protein